MGNGEPLDIEDVECSEDTDDSADDFEESAQILRYSFEESTKIELRYSFEESTKIELRYSFEESTKIELRYSFEESTKIELRYSFEESTKKRIKISFDNVQLKEVTAIPYDIDGKKSVHCERELKRPIVAKV